MIDKLKEIAEALHFLRIPSVVLGLVSLVAMMTIVVSSKSHDEDFYLIPSLVGVLWSITTYSFLVAFRTVPSKADQSWKFIRRLKRNVIRGGYWLLGVIVIGTTIGALFVSYRIIAIWARDYGG
jgi:hypothetical protein